MISEETRNKIRQRVMGRIGADSYEIRGTATVAFRSSHYPIDMLRSVYEGGGGYEENIVYVPEDALGNLPLIDIATEFEHALCSEHDILRRVERHIEGFVTAHWHRSEYTHPRFDKGPQREVRRLDLFPRDENELEALGFARGVLNVPEVVKRFPVQLDPLAVAGELPGLARLSEQTLKALVPEVSDLLSQNYIAVLCGPWFWDPFPSEFVEAELDLRRAVREERHYPYLYTIALLDEALRYLYELKEFPLFALFRTYSLLYRAEPSRIMETQVQPPANPSAFSLVPDLLSETPDVVQAVLLGIRFMAANQ